MSLGELIELARAAGVPPWLQLVVALALLLAGGWFAVAKLWRTTASADRQLLSADEQTFRHTMLDTIKEQAKQLKGADMRITDLTNQQAATAAELAKCQASHAECQGDLRVVRGEMAHMRDEMDLMNRALQRLTSGHD